MARERLNRLIAGLLFPHLVLQSDRRLELTFLKPFRQAWPIPDNGACQRNALGRQIPPIPKRIPASESSVPHLNILRSSGW
jgi:hypothetical protein